MSSKLPVRETKLIDVGNKLSRRGNKFLDSVPYIIPADKYKNSRTQQPNALTSRNLVLIS